jgi:hypothetical protein
LADDKKDVNPACLNFLKPFWLPPPPPPPELKRLPPPSFTVARGVELIAWPLVPCAGRRNLEYRQDSNKTTLFNKGIYFLFFMYLFISASSAAPQIPLCRGDAGIEPAGLLRLQLWQ